MGVLPEGRQERRVRPAWLTSDNFRAFPARGTTAAAASAAALATSGNSSTYTSSVKELRAWPSRAAMYLLSSPAAFASEAAPCRRSWNRTGGRPARQARVSKRTLTHWPGTGIPSSRVNTRPLSGQSRPQASRSAFCLTRQALSAETTGPGSGTTRSPESLFGPLPLPVSRTLAVPWPRLTSAHVRPTASSRRSPE